MRRRDFAAVAAAGLAQVRPAVGVAPDGMLLIGGRREFILGLYQLPRISDAHRAAREAGFRLVRSKPDAGQLALARDHGLYAWIALGSVSPAKAAESRERIRSIVEQCKNDPALLFWESEDEPTFVWKHPRKLRIPPSQIISTYRFVKELDPGRLFYLNHSPTNLVSTLRQYNPGTDIVATDIYPVIPRGIRESYALWPDGQQGDFLNTYISQVGQYTDKMRQVAGPSRPVFMVLQAFAWENLREEDRDPAMVLYPTRAQTRFMAYQAIARGANGLLYWGIDTCPAGSAMWEDLRALGKELSRIQSALAAERLDLPLRVDYHDTGHSLDRGIEFILKPFENGAVLIAVNADKNPVEASVAGLDGFQSAKVLFEDRGVSLHSGTLRDSFDPFAARVYALHR